MELPYRGTHVMYLIIHQYQSVACDTDALRLHSSALQHGLPFPLTAHRRKAHLPENRSLRIYLNKTEQYQILSIRKIFLPDVPPRTDQTVRDTASQSVHGWTQESLASERCRSVMDLISLKRRGISSATPFPITHVV